MAKYAHQNNMRFGVWVEPEMISRDSNLFQSHPDWCLQVEERRMSESRNQLILDLANPEVCNYVYDSMDKLLSGAEIDYIKWDMNRNMTEAYSVKLNKDQKNETSHRYMLGLYNLLEKLTTKHKNVLFESCSGGGGRFDAGMLYYMPQVWTSDNTDAIERLKIQYGTSLIYPAITMGAHVSAIPNHQVYRITDLKFRTDVAMAGNFGYELDLSHSTKDELENIKVHIKNYKKWRSIIQFGDLYRIQSGSKENINAWQYMSIDQSEVLLFLIKKLAIAQENFLRIKFFGLDEKSLYKTDKGEIFGGDELMYAGIDIPELKGDFKSHIIHLEKLNSF